MAVNSSVEGERRRRELVDLVENSGEISIEEARVRFDVSSMTIRRDLEMLETEGQLRRVRGGAVPSPTAAKPHDERLATSAAAKRAIARKAAALLPTRGPIALDASTTIQALAEAVGERQGLVALTNSIQTFNLLSRPHAIESHLTGGQHEPITGSLIGPLANAGARLLHTTMFFTSAASLDPASGTSEASLAEAEVKRVFASVSERTVLCIDSSKLGTHSPGHGLDPDQISTLITELDPRSALLDPYRSTYELI